MSGSAEHMGTVGICPYIFNFGRYIDTFQSFDFGRFIKSVSIKGSDYIYTPHSRHVAKSKNLGGR